jgi:LmbE family N-acetylglucosaminyl deacetylase
MNQNLTLMGIFAHPDDESLAFGGTLAKCADEGIKTSLVVATRGERGWYGDPTEYPGEEGLGKIREKELREAANVLGVSSLSFLDYIDGDLDQADVTEIIAKIVRYLRQERPQVVITFGPDGLYGHPDHIAISQFATAAVICSADQNYSYVKDFPPFTVSKFYYAATSGEWLTAYRPVADNLRIPVDGFERRATAWPGWAITTQLDAKVYWQQVWQAVDCHQTQYGDRFDHLSEENHKQLWGIQAYYRVFSLVNGGRPIEKDLFEGLRH